MILPRRALNRLRRPEALAERCRRLGRRPQVVRLLQHPVGGGGQRNPLTLARLKDASHTCSNWICYIHEILSLVKLVLLHSEGLTHHHIRLLDFQVASNPYSAI